MEKVYVKNCENYNIIIYIYIRTSVESMNVWYAVIDVNWQCMIHLGNLHVEVPLFGFMDVQSGIHVVHRCLWMNHASSEQDKVRQTWKTASSKRTRFMVACSLL